MPTEVGDQDRWGGVARGEERVDPDYVEGD